MVQICSIVLIVLLTSGKTLGKRQLSDYDRIKMLAKDIQAITYFGGGAAKLQTYLDSISSFSAKTVDGSKHLPEVATSIQEILNVRYKLVKNLKQVVEDSYKKRTKDTTSSVVNCCKHNAGSETEGENGFPFPVDYNKMCHFRPPSDNKPHAKLPNTDRLMKTFKENAVGLSIATWQYVVLSNGHTFTYPATSLDPGQGYNPRNEPWFIFVGVERREIMIVIDTSAVMSASVLGKKTHLDIAKEVAKTVILYTSDKDRVAVIKSQGDKGYLEDENKCFSRELALVTKKYYEDVKKHIGGLQAGGRSTYMDGLKLAKSLLEQGNKKNKKIILFISGVEPAEEDLQDQFNATFLQSTITIYTVNVGNSKKVQSVLQYMTKVSSKPGISIHINANKMIKKQMTPYRRHAMLPTIEQGKTASLSSPHRDLLGLGVIISVRQPAFHSEGRVGGMVGVDIRLTDLLYKSPGLHKGVNTYLFMFDRRDDSTFLHPLMPDTKAQNYVNIRILESVANDYGILDRMARGESGQKNITTSRLTSHGFLHRQGVRVVSVEAEYSWKLIDGTPLTLCLVVGKHDSKPVYRLPNTAADVPFLYAKGIKSDTQCKNFGRIVLKDKTSVAFTSDAFLDPVTFLASKVTPERIELYNNIVRGKSSVSLLKEGVLQEVAITALLHDLWTQPQSRATVTYAVWRYVFLTSGVLRVYPALVLPEHYEVLGRLWFENAKGMPGISAISTPYLDNWGGGYTITVSHAVYAGNPNHQHSEGDIVVGVVAVDVSIEYFQFLIQELFAECKQEDYSCFAIDVSGYVVIRESMLAPPVDKKPHKVANIHITDAEPVIAKHMLENGYMTKQSCYEFNNLDRYYTYKVYRNLTVEHMDENPCYNLWHVPKTTVFVLIKHKDKDHKETVVPKYEHCHNMTDFSTDGPCYVGNNIHICPPTPFSYDPWLPCTMTKSPKAIDFSYMKEEKKRINSITRCFEYRCREKRHRQECHMVVGCRWCVQNANGMELSHPFCGEYDKCHHGRINFPSPYPIAEGPKIGLILFFTILVASAIVVPFGYIVFRYKISHYEKRLTIDDHSAEPDM